MRLRLGFLGLGTMGEPLANNLRKAGHELTVWNRTKARTEHLVQKGAALAATPRECAAGRDAVFVCVADEKALEAVLEGADGILAGLREGDVLVDLGTSGTRAARSVAERAARRGARYVAAPLLGSKAAAEKAQVVIVAGGPGEARERVRPALHAISARLFELDSAVQAALLKLCVNAVGAAMITGFGEALALGASGGLEAGKVLEVLQASTFHSPLYLMKGELIQARDYEPRFAVTLAEKDQRLAQEAAADQGARLPVNEAVRALLAETVKSGRGDKDLAAVADLLLEWAGAKR
ncbi:MAG TPA: NAD(P)-dependent oxidoreductase [Anaeromyxobacteraceae bacterium]|nr:NAD(P)-dependent oxidoreductase [Anaeromyxobacteraceae bacterium]